MPFEAYGRMVSSHKNAHVIACKTKILREGDVLAYEKMKHPRRLRSWMRFYHMKNEYDVLRCPRCGMVIKEAGVPVEGRHFASLTIHVGSMHCMIVEAGRPLCKCGCGKPVNWDFERGRWREYFDHHRSKELDERLRRALTERGREKSRKLFEEIRGLLPCTQASLSEKMKINRRNCTRITERLERYGFIERERILDDGRWTYMLREKTVASNRGHRS
jgi:uncharacterized C2H2 Zn-finger protein